MASELKYLPQLVVEQDGTVSGKFLHGLSKANARDGSFLWNVRMGNGRFFSIEAAGKFDPSLSKTHRSMNDIPIEQLRADEHFCEDNFDGHIFSQRFARWVWPAGIYQNKGLSSSDGESAWRRIIETSDRELEFERLRRQFAPSVPSRLSCVYLAHGTDAGRAAIHAMLYQPEIFEVRIECCLAACVVDSAWYDLYLNNPKLEYIENYWRLMAHPTESRPEILIDGVFHLSNRVQLVQLGVNTGDSDQNRTNSNGSQAG
ncbi:hypothetical protein [Acidovorax sp.]|uniref:hypothetical protein n=1 Tax=Acidovorax sp. TaxID=1872122 RepID=UPI0025B919FC|nr:hypothetical protein [Acidovorax sp.]MCI5070140.1 DUF2441 domain-containing protein [Acidovorax sp.]